MPLPIYLTFTDETAAYADTAEDIAAIQSFARDYPWEGICTEPGHAADEVLAALRGDGDLHPEAEARLRAALVDSATEAM